LKVAKLRKKSVSDNDSDDESRKTSKRSHKKHKKHSHYDSGDHEKKEKKKVSNGKQRNGPQSLVILVVMTLRVALRRRGEERISKAKG